MNLFTRNCNNINIKTLYNCLLFFVIMVHSCFLEELQETITDDFEHLTDLYIAQKIINEEINQRKYINSIHKAPSRKIEETKRIGGGKLAKEMTDLELKNKLAKLEGNGCYSHYELAEEENFCISNILMDIFKSEQSAMLRVNVIKDYKLICNEFKKVMVLNDSLIKSHQKDERTSENLSETIFLINMAARRQLLYIQEMVPLHKDYDNSTGQILQINLTETVYYNWAHALFDKTSEKLKIAHILIDKSEEFNRNKYNALCVFIKDSIFYIRSEMDTLTRLFEGLGKEAEDELKKEIERIHELLNQNKKKCYDSASLQLCIDNDTITSLNGLQRARVKKIEDLKCKYNLN